MKILIVACGETGVTLKAAQKLALLVNADVSDGKMKDLSEYDAIVLGTNVRFGRLNKKFCKYAKKLKISDKKTFVFISGAEIEREEHYIELAREKLPSSIDIRYVWGELNANNVSGFKRYAVESFISGRKKDGLARPRLLDKEIAALSRSINECTKSQ